MASKKHHCDHHQGCIEDALQLALQLSQERKQRLTPLRQRVLELIWQSHRPIGAYEILAQLTEADGCSAPPTVYRALDFLLEQGFIHRINAINAYLGCIQPNQQHVGQIFICKHCKNATEVSDSTITASVAKAAEKQGFLVEDQWLEMVGLCHECQ